MPTVRCFVHSGLEMAYVAASNQFSTNGIFMLRQPPLGRSGVLTVTTDAQSTDASMAPVNTTLLHMEASPGSVIGYEISKHNDIPPRAADASSLRFAGSIQVPFGPGYTVSLIDMTGQP